MFIYFVQLHQPPFGIFADRYQINQLSIDFYRNNMLIAAIPIELVSGIYVYDSEVSIRVYLYGGDTIVKTS